MDQSLLPVVDDKHGDSVCILGEQLGVTKTIYINGMSGVREEGVVKTYSRVLSSHRARGFRRLCTV